MMHTGMWANRSGHLLVDRRVAREIGFLGRAPAPFPHLGHVQIVLHDEPVEVDVDEVQARRRAPAAA